ncbi:uncharacterized protein LOC142907103 [Petromyzon marinus]|uniref:uncharacterized protein LOC142907103 n=1 Tax=Petromyzon marinus TaxID=7757 RepID=UPI003F6EC163
MFNQLLRRTTALAGRLEALAGRTHGEAREAGRDAARILGEAVGAGRRPPAGMPSERRLRQLGNRWRAAELALDDAELLLPQLGGGGGGHGPQVEQLMAEGRAHQQTMDQLLARADAHLSSARSAVKSAADALQRANQTLATLRALEWDLARQRSLALAALATAPALALRVAQAEQAAGRARAALVEALRLAGAAGREALRAGRLARETLPAAALLKRGAAAALQESLALGGTAGRLLDVLDGSAARLRRAQRRQRQERRLVGEVRGEWEGGGGASNDAVGKASVARAVVADVLRQLNNLLEGLPASAPPNFPLLEALELRLDGARQRLEAPALAARIEALEAAAGRREAALATQAAEAAALAGAVEALAAVERALPAHCYNADSIETS